jgi:multidrug efflux system membrane fusion protein
LDVGDHVTQGTELAAVRPIDYEQKVSEAQTQVVQAQAQLTQAKAGLQDSELDYNRAKNLFESASLVKPQYDQAKAGYEVAQARVAAAQAQLNAAYTLVEEAKLALHDTSLRAPFNGWIAYRNADPGGLVGNTTLAFVLVETDLVKAVFAVPDVALGSVRLGQKLAITLQAVAHPIEGAVTSISQAADPKTRVFSIEVTIPNPKDELRPGMIGSLSLGSEAAAAPQLVVPLGALIRPASNPRGFAVFRIEERDQKTFAALRNIQTGKTLGDSIEVTSGLADGERVVGLGASLLRDGQEVRVLP